MIKKMRTPKPSGNSFGFHERKVSSYDRHAGHVVPGRRILIVCEGAKTEPDYFRELRRYFKLSTVEVEIEENAGAPGAIVNKAQQMQAKRKRDETFDEIWCVFDREARHLNPTFDAAVQKAGGLKYHLAISNPAFEYWYILHFECTTRVFANGEEVKAYLREHHIPGYEESMPMFHQIMDKTNLAIHHAENLCENHPAQEGRFPNPSTTVHSLVKELIEMSPSTRAYFSMK
jgi:hypothetical protein